jgi:5'-3' exonuclease
MGICNFYPLFCRKFPSSVSKSFEKKYEAVAIDLNQWLHANFEKFKYNIEKLVLECFYFLDSWECDTLIVVLDGPSPPPKMLEQKKRRQKKNCNVEITVGTTFMENFKNKLLFFLKYIAKTRTVYFSSHNVFGEGEHKIIDLILKINKKTLIISIDADVILLCILNNLRNANILRIYRDRRETIEIAKALDEMRHENISPNMFFLNVCLMGNDFLPKMKSKLEMEYNFKNEFNFKIFSKNHNLLDYNVEGCENFLSMLIWIFEYYKKPFFLKNIPLESCFQKLSLKQLEQYCYDTENFIPKFRSIKQFETTIPYQHEMLTFGKCGDFKFIEDDTCLKFSNKFNVE